MNIRLSLNDDVVDEPSSSSAELPIPATKATRATAVSSASSQPLRKSSRARTAVVKEEIASPPDPTTPAPLLTHQRSTVKSKRTESASRKTPAEMSTPIRAAPRNRTPSRSRTVAATLPTSCVLSSFHLLFTPIRLHERR